MLRKWIVNATLSIFSYAILNLISCEQLLILYIYYIYIKRVSVGSVQAWPVFSRPGDPEQTAP